MPRLLGAWSPRARLTAAATAALAICLCAAAVALVWRVHTGLVADLDKTAESQATALAAAAASSPSPRVSTIVGLNDVSQIINTSGQVVAASANVEGERPVFDVPPAPAGSAPAVRTVRARPIDNTEYRVAAVLTDGTPQYRVYVGLPLAEVARSTDALATALAVGVPVLLTALALLTWLFAGMALKPTNELLDRLDTSLRHQRQFVADAAHELRSPVAAIRSQLEVADRIDNDGTPSPLTQESVRLSHLIDDLLALAKIDATPQHRQEPLDLDHLVYDEAQLLRERTDRIVDTRDIHACQVVGDAPLLARAVRNLLDNAARHATTRVTITVRSRGEDAEVTVADDGPGIPVSDRIRVLERFTRLDDARARDTGGVGLGLAIVDDIVKIHGGRLTINDNTPGARITMTLPPHQRIRNTA
ncbi:MAG: HAMP domain-containing histidine kinase [Actinomycetota bacterium]|nr:HAMP domain-containing histidine kinase [Actinomycetota bacterium]